MQRVLKFGGAALCDGPAVQRAVRLVQEHGGPAPAVVVSAHAGVTDGLHRAIETAARGELFWDPLRVRHRSLLAQLGLPGDFLDRHLRELRAILEELRTRGREDRRMRDFVLSFGERMSARVFAAVLRRVGCEATPMDAFDLGLVTEGGWRELQSAPELVARHLRAAPGIPVVTGYVALDREGHLVTLGRNGSDLSAVWLAEAAGAEEVHLWKSVPGLLTADPRRVPQARLVPHISWSDAAELASHGADLLHPGAVERAQRSGIPLRVRDVERPDAPGTRIAGESDPGRPVALAHREGLALLHLRFDLERDHGAELVKLFSRFSEAGLEPFACGVSGTEADLLVPDVPELETVLGSAQGFVVQGFERELSSIAVVGPDVGASAALTGELHGVAEALRVPLLAAPGPPSPRSQLVVLQAERLPAYLQALHQLWFGNRERGHDSRGSTQRHGSGRR